MEIALLILAVVLAGGLVMVYRNLSESRKMLAVNEEQLASSKVHASEIENELKQSRARITELSDELVKAKTENSSLSTRLQLLGQQFEEMQLRAEERFRNLANEILTQNSRTFKQQNEERLGEILTPLRAEIDAFKKKVEDTYSEESRQIFSLKEHLKDLRDLSESMGREARELAGALRGNNGVQGAWGEMVLDKILEQSGLRLGFEYDIQATSDSNGVALTDETGARFRPDVIVHYPDNRCVIIDSKASMKAYMEYAEATDDRIRAAAGREHVNSVRRHADKLAAKRYDELPGDESLDFVMMFIPTEAAYIAAMRLEPTLWQQAYDKRVLIVSPTHLVSALKIIEQLWRRERQTANVVKIAQEAGKMYDKFVAFVADMQKIERSLDTTRKACDDAMKKLSNGTGNLVSRAEKLRELGVKTSKTLPKALIGETESDDIDETPSDQQKTLNS
ncbi:MAG: DNA recombination protein RmuC [Lachnoclostridium sp.]|nr:DNA recombination protein RmuC [Lachnoclostridium sp.]